MIHRHPPILPAVFAAFGIGLALCSAQTDSLPPLINGQSPQTLDEVWGDYDPTVEPLETEVHKDWVEEGTVLRAVRYCIGTFKGEKSWMGGFYAYPEGGTALPALLQIHGGGGAASKQACIENAQRGYATFSMNWREDERFTELENLAAAAQTDWGAVEGKQVKESRGIEPDNDLRYDPVPSARNSGYFLRTLAARRALTFLEQQPEVDGSKLGIDGHSMGGVITLQTAAMDARVKAAAPSCAPPLLLDGTLLARTANPAAYAEKIKGAMLFMSPSNDFHGMVEDVEWVNQQMPSTDIRIARSEHLNHKHNPSSLAAKWQWFDAHLKGTVAFPEEPTIAVHLKSDNGHPAVQITPDSSMPIDRADVFFTRDAKENENATNRTRYWQFSKAVNIENRYEADLRLFDLEKPLWVFANIHYTLPARSEDSADTFVVTTRLFMATPEELQATGAKTDSQTSTVVESFDENWEREWVVSGNQWESWCLNDPRVPLPHHSKLVLEVQCDEANQLTVDIGDHRNVFPIAGGASPEKIEILPFDLTHKTTKVSLLNWQNLIRPRIALSSSRSKATAIFKKLSWEDVPVAEFMELRPFQLEEAAREDGKTLLTFETADAIVGRIEPDNTKFKTERDQVESDYKVGLHVHSHSELTYFLKGEFSKFTATIVPCYQASVTFEVYADGERLFDSGKIGGKSAPQELELDISGAQELKLVVTEGGNGWGGDWVMWADASLN